MREAGADGYAFFLRDPETLKLARQDAGCSAIAEDAFVNPLVVTYPLETDGVLAFAFHEHAGLREVRPQLDRIAGTIEAVWRADHTAERYSQLANHVAAMERVQSFQNMWRLIQATLTPMEVRVLAFHDGHGLPLAIMTHQMRLLNPSGAKAHIVNARRKLKAVLRNSDSRTGTTSYRNRSANRTCAAS
jgi:hypothetical protein